MAISEHMRLNGRSFVGYLEDNTQETQLATVASASEPSPENFDMIVPDGEYFELERITFGGRFSGGLIRADSFFGITALTNGMLFQILDESLVIDEDFDTTEVPIRQHQDLAGVAGIRVDQADESSGASGAVNAEWVLGGDSKAKLLRPAWRFRVVVQDALDGLDSFRIMFHGVISSSYRFTTGV